MFPSFYVLVLYYVKILQKIVFLPEQKDVLLATDVLVAGGPGDDSSKISNKPRRIASLKPVCT